MKDISSADNLVEFYQTSQEWSLLFDTLIVFLKEFFEKVNFEKSQQTTSKAQKIELSSWHNCSVMKEIFWYPIWITVYVGGGYNTWLFM